MRSLRPNIFRICNSLFDEKGHHLIVCHKRALSSQRESNDYDEAPIFRRHGSQSGLREGPGLQHFIERSRSPINIEKSDAVLIKNKDEMLQILESQLNAAKLTSYSNPILMDSHNRFHNYLRISLTERCNLRCSYCMPENGVKLQPNDALLTSEEVIKVAKLFVEAGVNKVRLTGGEPLLRKDLVEIVGNIRDLGVRHIGITTNGINLKGTVQDLAKAGLTHINISLDTLIDERFSAITRRKGLSHVLNSIDAALEAGFGGKLKINCVVMKGVNDDELSNFVQLSEMRKLNIRFIEWMPFNSNGWDQHKLIRYRNMLGMIRESFPSLERETDDFNDTTKWYRVPGFEGKIGFITSMSEHFCGSCNRLRVLADGSLKVCLFDGNETLSLRDAIRYGFNDDELSLLVRAAVMKKKDILGGHGDMLGIAKSSNRPMILIGG